jgi:hypothetical protein
MVPRLQQRYRQDGDLIGLSRGSGGDPGGEGDVERMEKGRCGFECCSEPSGPTISVQCIWNPNLYSVSIDARFPARRGWVGYSILFGTQECVCIYIQAVLLREFLKNKIKFVIRDTLLKQALTPSGHGWIEFQKLDMKKTHCTFGQIDNIIKRKKLYVLIFQRKHTHTRHMQRLISFSCLGHSIQQLARTTIARI